MAIIPTYDSAPFDESDPDDYRPRLAMGASRRSRRDVREARGRHHLIVEEIAPGDRIPLHTHPINEVIVILEGDPEVTLGDETRTLGPGGVVFIPAGTPHRTRNATTSRVRVHAMFPSERIGIEYLERNPAPGTEDDPPQPAVTIDVRALMT
jgi:quercetin dioxygenase-like cupin family protein